MGKVAIAYSGGVDSSFILAVAKEQLGSSNVIAITAHSETYPVEEIEASRQFANKLGIRHLEIKTAEIQNEHFASNPPDRCYFCKYELFSKLRVLAEQYGGIRWLLDGSTADDSKDYRPGRKAALELGVRSPLAEANLTKSEIRLLSKQMGLPTWSKPAQPCLASRFPYGIKITPEKLKQVATAERIIKTIVGDNANIRVRHHGNLARIEVDTNYIHKLVDKKHRERIVNEFKRLGYLWVTIDLEGYRQGSLNEALKNYSDTTTKSP